MITFCLISGLILLFVGGEALVRGAVGTARLLAVSPLLIGLTVVAMATSAPELVVSLQAALNERPAIAIGNVIGSNIANILLILGAASLIATLPCRRALVYRDGSMMLLGSFLLLGLVYSGSIERWHGIGLLLVLAAFIIVTFLKERRGGNGGAQVHESEADEVPSPPGGTLGAAIALLVGIAALVGGAELLVYGATETARAFGVSEAVIGLSLVAVGTSLPELASCGVAAWRGHTDVALGNVIGSNIFNVFAILGATATTIPVPIDPHFTGLDIWVMLVASVLLLPLMMSGAKLSRLEGSLFLTCYAGYIGWLYYGL
ncbi:MAG TPA: calcium/sodium antiporter [Alphaproteobacteria bacterium]|nr:calcium/sodium antiporter [Alphaproteobacteria bacterium]